MNADKCHAGIKEVVTLTSDLSRKNLEKDFERMDTPQGTFYRMSRFQPFCRGNLVVAMLTTQYRRLLRHPPCPRWQRIQCRASLSRRGHGTMHSSIQVNRIIQNHEIRIEQSKGRDKEAAKEGQGGTGPKDFAKQPTTSAGACGSFIRVCLLAWVARYRRP